MTKCCKNCKHSVRIKNKKYSYPVSILFCLFSPPSCQKQFGSNRLEREKTLKKYANYPVVTHAAPCSFYCKKPVKEVEKLVKKLKKERDTWLKKIEGERIKREKIEEEKKEKNREIKKKEQQLKKRRKYAKIYRQRKKEEAEDYNRFDILEIRSRND